MDGVTTGPNVGRKIRAARQRKGLTQVELAQLTGVGRETVGNWENDRTSPDGALPRIEEALDITLSEGEAERIAESYTMEALLDRLRAAEREIDRARAIARRLASDED